ncbi:TlpA family protein disulfide reductase [Candidatus Pelagibacter sp.]|jgi:thiol-disulfide isomerase/thioredoxin|nr:TlpA family protein disulfide reductase [Candidatus Pelagibacter sp.]MDB3897742.1 TlpA family protein disulfide reductase [Candidatus Pelagibacter sp.]MDC0293419.1 TlpA family protein disulfide reductase [Candidatus Pelagibacter sp.]MDC0350316.1 TlpA family protein disulfide reductase [Candidatus Pelagibacter sp.]MDC1272562.1 TlpA family protein disulfide reductase [Pelagibacteraceae bacterium]|tara:strand:- start:201 stop:710 length:510 start_codon:yes stop_codon:yes gene_type:complete
MRFLILFTFLISNVLADDLPKIKNIVIHKDLKTYDNVIFLDQNDQKINIKDFNGNLILLNFWATWCEPCKEEMPSLDRLQNNSKLSNIKIFPINISQESLKKINDFFKDLNIEYLEPYYDAPTTLAKALSLRGVPTSILFNTEGKEFARIIGSIDFDNLEFIEWLKNYN